MRKALFLDRDGTINVDKGYTHKITDLKFIEGMPKLIKKYNEKGYLVIVITNQAGVARGYYSEEDVEIFNKYMNLELQKYGAHVDAFYFCPHHPTEGTGEYRVDCNCRKPNTGMIDKAVQDWKIDLAESILIGDKNQDIECGKKAGIGKTIKIRSKKT